MDLANASQTFISDMDQFFGTLDKGFALDAPLTDHRPPQSATKAIANAPSALGDAGPAGASEMEARIFVPKYVCAAAACLFFNFPHPFFENWEAYHRVLGVFCREYNPFSLFGDDFLPTPCWISWLLIGAPASNEGGAGPISE